MSHVVRSSYTEPSKRISEEDIKKIRDQRKWQTVAVDITQEDLVENIEFLNDAVVLRQSPEGVPLMTTTAIYGPIRPGTKVALTPGTGTGVRLIEEKCTQQSLIEQLVDLERKASKPKDGNAATLRANWVSSKDGGMVPSLDESANVFGSTGSLYVNEKTVTLPVLDVSHPDYHQTLAFYGAKLLTPNEEFCIGFNQVLFGMEYNTSLPDYIRNYAMSPFGGGGLFVEHHPFPHIFLPRPTKDGQIFCEAKVTLGHKVKDPEDKIPKIIFTTFRIPSDGSALAIKPEAIHNDSFTNGRLAVFVANTAADTVAFRETSPFTNISVKDK
ncbi:MAG: hypothetical protein P4L41_04310 [Flavipsychrobacter sp.]|nr:hypothetical protein [Flavipsychrobacter sp.]